MMNTNLEHVKQRVQRYWYEDGLVEIATGCLFLVVGLLLWLEVSAPQGSLWHGMTAILFPLVVIGGMALMSWVVRLLKERVTYPRTGYVAYPQRSPNRRRVTGILGFVIAFGVAVLAIRWQDVHGWLPLVQGLLLAAFMLYQGYLLGLVRFYGVALVSVISGLWGSLGGMVVEAGQAANFGLVGLSLGIAGVWTLRAYLAHTQPQQGE